MAISERLSSMFFFAPLFDSWLELMKECGGLIGLLIIVQLTLSIIFFYIWENCRITEIYHRTAKVLSKGTLLGKWIIFWVLSTFIISPYLSYLGASLFLYSFVIYLFFIVTYTVFLCVKKFRIVLISKNCFYYLLHFVTQQFFAYCIYIIVYKVRFWEMYSFPKEEKHFWLGEIYPEMGILRRCCDDFIAILCLMAIPYMILGIYGCVKYLVGRLKLLWH